MARRLILGGACAAAKSWQGLLMPLSWERVVDLLESPAESVRVLGAEPDRPLYHVFTTSKVRLAGFAMDSLSWSPATPGVNPTEGAYASS